MKLQLFRLRCGACDSWFQSPQIGEMAYGEFLLRSPSGEMRYLNAIVDSVFSEVDELIGRDSLASECDERERVRILDAVFGAACDADSRGDVFVIGKNPPCPRCHQHNIVEWESVEPIRYVDIDVQPVTHAEWSKVSKDAKELRIREFLEKAL